MGTVTCDHSGQTLRDSLLPSRLLFPPLGWDVESGEPRLEVAKEGLVSGSEESEQVKGQTHVVPGLGPNHHKG